MPGQFELYRDALGKHRWRLLSSTGRIVAKGGEGYDSKRAALNAIDLVRNSGSADLEDSTKSSAGRTATSRRSPSSVASTAGASAGAAS